MRADVYGDGAILRMKLIATNWSEVRHTLSERAESAYHWIREWMGELDDILLALMVYALAGIWLFYAIWA